MELKVRTIGEHELTDEMNALMDAIEAGEDVKGFAFAGAGKSTFLRAVEKYQTNKMGIYLCYNKSLEREARGLFVGTNVHIYTSHSYALSSFSKEVKTGFLRKVNLKPNPKMVLEFAEFNLENTLFESLDMKKNWRILVDICDCFIQTASLEISEIHLVEKAKKLIEQKVTSKALKANQKKLAQIYLLNHASLLLKSMFDTKNECFCTHDGYVKFWQLSKPVIKYDYIMFDETQDAPPVLVNVIMSQKAQKIFVGDQYQNIYQFKGGVNAMTVVPCEPFPLSVSFRYGQELADLASKILNHVDTKLKITGKGFDTEIIKGSDYDDADNLLYIAHTNIHLLDVLIDCYKSKVPTVFVTDNKPSFTLMKAESILSISQNGEGIGFYKKYDNIDKLIAEQRDLETKVIVEWFKEDREKFMDLIMALRWTLDIIPDKAFIRLCTAHGSKGLEFDNVMLADDFNAVQSAFGDGQPLAEDELNLIYVAVTRAKKKLILSDKLHEALTKNLAFTLQRHKPAKCMMDNLIPESYVVKKKTGIKKVKATVQPEQKPSTETPAEIPSVQPKQPGAVVKDSDSVGQNNQASMTSSVPDTAEKVSKPLVSSSDAKSTGEMAIVVGQSKETGEDMLWCPTDTSLYLNPNLAVAGTMGTGKTQTVKSIVTQICRQKALNTGGESLGILIFDYKSDYCDQKFVNATGAQVLEPTNLPINPFALHSDERLAVMNNAKVFISTLSKVFRLGVKQEQTLKNCILAAYENKGIDKGDVSTYINTPPTLRDVVAAYNNQLKIPQDSLTSALSDLYDFEIFETNGRKCKTLYDLLDDNVVVVSLGGLDPNLQDLIVAILLDQFYIQMHLADKPKPRGQYRALKKLVLVDEADNFMSSDFPSLRKILKEGREFGVGCILSTQGLDHFQTSENSYSDFMTSWISHRLNNPKNKDVEQLLNTKSKQELESQLNRVRELEKHHALFVDGKKQVTHQHSTMFWKLVESD
ncbi:3'-5' exonuclease [Vibrio alfacsensis]|uniref:3'-5' exonuclease n=1 Tax=Vibrio alfacsensis TaxID=1074311 RepID=UPI001C821BA2|nr:3'-5' exonuclease [Vibrio alfacsensis]